MARADLGILAGVGIFALARLVADDVYVYWKSNSYRDRKRRLETQMTGAHALRLSEALFSGTEATMSMQLSHHFKTSLYRVMFGNTYGESIDPEGRQPRLRAKARDRRAGCYPWHHA